MATTTNPVEDRADLVMAAILGGNNDKTSLYKYLLARLAQNARTPAPSNKAGIGRLLGTFALPMIVQGMQSWKDRYDARGDFKANGATLLGKLMRGETLSQNEQASLDNYRAKYPKEYEAALASLQPAATQSAPQPPQPQPQGAQNAPPQPTPLAQEIAKAANLPNPDWQAQEHPATEAMPQANGGAFSGINYDDQLAQYGQQIMNGLQNAGRSLELEELLRAFGGGLR